jgi:hypothetical protein
MAWKNPFARRSSGPALLFPHTVDLGHGVSVTVHLADCPTSNRAIPCWVYLTNGFAQWGQKEILFALARDANEDPSRVPEEPFPFFSAIIPYAQGGTLVDAGGLTWFDPKTAPFGGHILYIDAPAIPNVAVPPRALAAVLIRDDELAIAQQYGTTRVMARLAFATRHYPCPPWSDRRRVNGRSTAPPEDTMLGKVAIVQPKTVTTLFGPGSLRIRTTDAQREVLRTAFDQRPAGVPLALLSAIDPLADGCLVWQPGMQGLNAVTPSGSTGSHVSGAFVLLAVGADADQFVLIEDGFALMLTTDTGERLMSSLTTGDPIELAVANGVRVTVEDVDQTPLPTAGASVVLLHSDDLLNARGASTSELSEYIRACFRILDCALLAGTVPSVFTVVLVVKPGGRAKAWVGAETPPEHLAVVRSELEHVVPPPLHGGPVAFALRGGPNGHPGNPSRSLFPREWQEAASAAAAALGKNQLTVDEVIGYMWPEKI